MVLFSVDINRGAPSHTAIKKADRQSVTFFFSIELRSIDIRISIVPGIFRLWACPFKPGAHSLKIHAKLTLRAHRPQRRTVNSKGSPRQKSKSMKKTQSHPAKPTFPSWQQELQRKWTNVFPVPEVPNWATANVPVPLRHVACSCIVHDTNTHPQRQCFTSWPFPLFPIKHASLLAHQEQGSSSLVVKTWI